MKRWITMGMLALALGTTAAMPTARACGGYAMSPEMMDRQEVHGAVYAHFERVRRSAELAVVRDIRLTGDAAVAEAVYTLRNGRQLSQEIRLARLQNVWRVVGGERPVLAPRPAHA